MSELLDAIADRYEEGWQPADLAYLGAGRLSRSGLEMLADAIRAEAERSGAAHRAPRHWVAQLDGLDVAPRGRSGSDDVLAWVRWQPPLPALCEPPSRWTRGRGSGARPGRGAPAADAAVLARVRALVAKAESTEFGPESEAFMAKAQELMTRHALDRASLVDDAGVLPAGPAARRLHVVPPHANAKAQLVFAVAGPNDVAAVWSRACFATIVGEEADLDAVEVLVTSLMVQATAAAREAARARQRTRTPSFTRTFLLSFAHRIEERLRAAREAAVARADRPGALVLASKRERADAELARLFPRVGRARRTQIDPEGYAAGRAAADRARLGPARSLRPAAASGAPSTPRIRR